MAVPVVYLDTCALNRLTDDLGQPRLFAEAQAMTTIFTLIQNRQVRWLASTILALEISRNPDPYKRLFASSLLPPQHEWIAPSTATHVYVQTLTQQGISTMDALHLALAHQAGAEWFITTDDRLLKRTAARTHPPLCVNPVDWLRRRQLWLVPSQ